MRKTAVHVKDIVAALLQTQRFNAVSTEEQLMRNWEWIVACDRGSGTRPVSIKNNVLLVLVSNSSWLHQLSMQKREIIGRICEIVGEGVIRDIRFKIGNPRAGIV